jgi:hypothetical protein
MKIQGCDLHARQQTIAMVDTETGDDYRSRMHSVNASARLLRLPASRTPHLCRPGVNGLRTFGRTFRPIGQRPPRWVIRSAIFPLSVSTTAR